MRRFVIALLLLLVLVVGIAAWFARDHRTTSQPANLVPANNGKVVPAAAASPRDDGNWTMPGKDYASTRFSGLNEITPANVGKLQVSMTFSTGTTEGFEAPPLVVGNMMYVVAPWPNDVSPWTSASRAARHKWTYKPNPAAASKGVACCGAGQSGRGLFERPAILEHARRAHRRGRRGQPARKSGGPRSPTSRRARR